MSAYITVDSGTTNTRVSLVVENTIVDTLKFSVAVSEGETRKEALSRQLKSAIREILIKHEKTPQDICRIIACGMITSDIGIINLEHINSPCGVYELAQNIYETTIEEISKIPFAFIRGVKCVSENYVDMMRGEETEIYGIHQNPEKNCLYVLPGSHSKLIYIDDDGRISHFSTELTGEMISAIANNTILKSIIDLNQTAVDSNYLQNGFLFSKEHGINAALFKTRSLKMFSNCSNNEILSFFIGAVLAPEIANIINASANKVIVGGKNQLKEPTATLLKLNSSKQIETVPEQIADLATVYGAIRIYERAINL